MKMLIASSVLLILSTCSVFAQEALRPAALKPGAADRTLSPLVNRNDWVNPENLAPMPQCIAQQDTTLWLSVMTQCVWRQCTRHFGFICTHHQWLIQLSCLSTSFSPDVVKEYLPYCDKSVLAKAQLFQWIHTIAGRTWLVDVGDTVELQSLSPASLSQGYAAVDVTSKAPTCLTDSSSAESSESFQHAMASCGFTADTQHTGNAARPWEYSEALQSLIALDYETVGFDLTQHIIAHGDYFDKHCFCKAFSIDPTAEPCPNPGLAMTRERLWMIATCGNTSLPRNWTDGLQTTAFDYIPTEDWRWPTCVDDMPKKVLRLPDRCTTNACELDSDGYCTIKRAVDRACFCRDITYKTCQGSCQVFETRIGYVNWLNDLCGGVEGWHGLPKHWRQLADLTTLDMIPWSWRVKSLKDLDAIPVRDPKLVASAKACASTDSKLASLALISVSALLVIFFIPQTGMRLSTRNHVRLLYPTSWLSKGLAITTLYLFANWMNAALVRSTPGYEDVPTIRLMLLWCSIPRPSWVVVLLVAVQSFKATGFSTIASCLFAETILQTLSAFHILATISYGREHNFYGRGMARLETSLSAQFMYTGALLWIIVMVVTLVLLLCSRPITTSAGYPGPKSQANHMTQNIVEGLVTPFNERWLCLEDRLVLYWINKSWDLEEELLLKREEQAYTTYGTLPVKSTDNRFIIKGLVRLYLIMVISMILLWIAQCFFLAGFMSLSTEEYCPPNLGALTLIWIISTFGVAIIS